jgi:iron-sulfur cluster repair protein YtfE (RIC family)
MTTATLPRRPDEPAPDLLDYTVVHRAMTADVRRLAAVAEGVARGHEPFDARRAAAFRAYLAGISAEIRSHHHVEDEHVWPVLVAVAPEAAGLAELTGDHGELDPLLDTAEGVAARIAAAPDDRAQAATLATVLAELSRLLDRHIADEERVVFPMIRRHVRVADYRRLQRRFRGNLSLHTLAFVVPWVAAHATEDEHSALLGDAGLPLRVLLRIVGGRFAAQQAVVFG